MLVYVGLVAFEVWVTPIKISAFSYEYSGTCGQFRGCSEGIRKRCRHRSSRAPGSKPVKAFADDAACDAAWQRLTWSSRGIEWQGGGRARPGTPAWIVERLLDFYESVDDAQAGKAVASRLPSPEYLQPYSLAPCGGRAPRFDDSGYEVVLAGNLDADPDLDCWSLTSAGELRQLSRD